MTAAKTPATFGAWVEFRRNQLDLTQSELGKRAGCSEAAIRKIEADERKPSRQLAELLAHVLEIPTSEEKILSSIFAWCARRRNSHRNKIKSQQSSRASHLHRRPHARPRQCFGAPQRKNNSSHYAHRSARHRQNALSIHCGNEAAG